VECVENLIAYFRVHDRTGQTDFDVTTGR